MCSQIGVSAIHMWPYVLEPGGESMPMVFVKCREVLSYLCCIRSQQVLQVAFSQFGPISKALVVADPVNNKSKWLVHATSL